MYPMNWKNPFFLCVCFIPIFRLLNEIWAFNGVSIFKNREHVKIKIYEKTNGLVKSRQG